MNQTISSEPEDIKDPKHVKITSYVEQTDGSVKRITESYYNDIASRKHDVVKSFPTSKETFYTDLISSCDVLMQKHTPEIQFNIITDSQHRPKKIVRTYTLYKEDLGRH